MKLIIDIPEMAYEAFKEWHKNKVATVEQSIIANGTPYEERQGEWIDTGYGTRRCSVCGEKCQTYCYPYNMDKPRDRYCLWCGASMLANDRQVTGKLKQPCPCDTCQTRIDRCGCQMHLCSDYQKWKEGEAE